MPGGCGGDRAVPRAFAQWQPSERSRSVDQDHRSELSPATASRKRKVERIASGMRWCEGPVWFGDGRYLLWSDIPNNRIMKWDEETGRGRACSASPRTTPTATRATARAGSLTCEHDTRRVHAHRVRRHDHGDCRHVSTASRSTLPNDIVCKSDGSIWFTDPPFGILGNYEGHVAKPELPTNVYRVDGQDRQDRASPPAT